jgi:hypothetical protein
MPPYFSYVSGRFADPPARDRPRPPSHRFYWAVLAIGLVALLALVTVHGLRKGIGLEDAWLLVLVLCTFALPNALVALLFRSLRQAAKRLAAVSAMGLVVSFVGFGFSHDANKARISDEQRAARALAQGGTSPGSIVIEKEGAPAPEGSR